MNFFLLSDLIYWKIPTNIAQTLINKLFNLIRLTLIGKFKRQEYRKTHLNAIDRVSWKQFLVGEKAARKEQLRREFIQRCAQCFNFFKKKDSRRLKSRTGL